MKIKANQSFQGSPFEFLIDFESELYINYKKSFVHNGYNLYKFNVVE